MKRLLATVAATAALAACATGPTLRSEHVLTGTARAAFAGEVKIVMEGAPQSGDVEEVAIVTATGFAADASLPAVLGALQREAAALGCTAVVRVRYDRGTGGATATGVAVRLR
jgi:uncharacterized protein YbjQ (UPF0145 family)